MIDRESKFADKEIVGMLKTDFVPVAIDQWYTRRQKDAEGEFYQRVAKQGPRKDMNQTTQGLYVCDATGKLLGYNNNRQSDRIKAIMRSALGEVEKSVDVELLRRGTVDPICDRSLPDGALVVRVNSKVLSGYEETDDKYLAIFQRSTSRDNLWILADEKRELINGIFPDSLARRIARFHLVDNTRGEPLMWTDKDVESVEIRLDADGNITGMAILKSADGERGYKAALRGVLKVGGDAIERFDVVAKGRCYGDGPYTKFAPEGKFPLAVAFRLAEGTDAADAVAPQGSKGWLQGYLEL